MRFHPPASAWRSLSLWIEFFTRPGADREMFAAFVNMLEADRATSVITADSALFRRGLAPLTARPDKEWSLTDCISFVVMEDGGLRDALTADRHFEQAGFRTPLQD